MEPYFATDRLKIYHGDCRDVLTQLPDESVQTVVTSPPYYGLRDYQVDGQIGLEQTPDEYVTSMVEVFREVRRVLREDGTLWLNMGDSYCGSPRGNKNGWEGSGLHGVESAKYQETLNAGTAKTIDKTKIPGLKPKDLIGIPWRLALALQADGWWLRQDIIWHKNNPMPESVTDRCTKAHEYIFLMTRAAKYYYDAEAIKEPAEVRLDADGTRHRGNARELTKEQTGRTDGFTRCPENSGRDGTRNKRSVWTVNTAPYKGAHFATFPPKLIDPCIKAGCPEGGTVLDPFHGSGTTGQVALNHSCNYIGIELNEDYIKLSLQRFKQGRLKW